MPFEKPWSPPPARLRRARHVLGILSLIFWSLFLLVTLKYVFVLLRADFNGEGGTFALMALAQSVGQAQQAPHPAARHCRRIVSSTATPPSRRRFPSFRRWRASRSSRPAFEKAVVPLSVAILIGLFAMQSRGTAQGRRPVRSHHRAVVWRAGCNRRHVHRRSNRRVLAALQPDPRLCVSAAQRPDRIHRPRPGVPRRDGRRGASTPTSGISAACRSRPRGSHVALPALTLNYLGQGALVLGNPRRSRTPSS